MQFIDLKRQYEIYREAIHQGMQRVLDHGRFIMGPEIAELEAKLAAYVGVRHALTCASGTDALFMALLALGVGPGDEVITVPFTWISSAEVICLAGARPIFVDIDPETFNLDPDKLEAAISVRTKAIIAVDLFGQMADYEAITAVAKRHGVAVIEDAAQSLGATQHGVAAGAQGIIACTSFFPSKTLGCYGDGGACFTRDDDLAARMRAIRTHGGEQRHHHTVVGMNARFDTLQAAVLLAKWPHFPEEIAQRRRLGERYSQLLDGLCVVPRVAPGNTMVYAQYTIRVPALAREAVQEVLETKGIPSAIYYPKCLHEQPVFAAHGYHFGISPQRNRPAERS